MIHTATRHELTDARLETALGSHTLAELVVLQTELQDMHRAGRTVGQIAVALQHHSTDIGFWLVSRDCRDDAAKVTMLLGALSVAIAWQTYRARSAPEFDIRRAMERIDAGVAYTLPIPRHKPCFCGSEMRYRDCHGHPPVAANVA
jgi:hypothetical protein